MSVADDIAKVTEQEQRLVFDAFDEATALTIGDAIRQIAVDAGVAVAIDIRFFNRPLFYYAMKGTSADNPDWLRRKGNCVRRWDRSSYLSHLRLKRDNRTPAPDHNVDPTEYAIHGGAFPIRIKGVGVVGSITASGLPQRDDHAFVVKAICQHLGINPTELALGPETP
ncbi:heme-degrading domain-containing protein [Devosia sp. ZB163]|uniref:heme-degrading domain-containing protein n=1 Tax=Devosia sp. ZB163 TaxID=3025938 RepID=UPI00235F2B5D|nr:heme-degrading domain-containing protein [Devosia sp. ZB163]MDC9825973.1 heme-degrading domain-containing protein [Devosia sp. ZB163]